MLDYKIVIFFIRDVQAIVKSLMMIKAETNLCDKFWKIFDFTCHWDLEKQEGCGVVAHERLTEPRITMEWLLAKLRSFSNLSAFLDLNGIVLEKSFLKKKCGFSNIRS